MTDMIEIPAEMAKEWLEAREGQILGATNEALADAIRAALPVERPEPEGDDWRAWSERGGMCSADYSREGYPGGWARWLESFPDTIILRPESRILEAEERAESAEGKLAKVRAVLESPVSLPSKMMAILPILDGGDS